MNPKVEFTFDYDFTLLGIISPAKPYKMAWLINHILGMRLVKQADYHLEFLKQQSLQIVSYQYQTVHNTYRLVKNRAVLASNMTKPFLLPELESFDYLFIIDDNTGSIDIDADFLPLKEHKLVHYINQFEPLELKNRDNLIF